MAVHGADISLERPTSLSRSGAEDFELFCQQCDRDDIRLPAFGYCVDCGEHLCQTCFTTHRRPKSLRHHQLLDKDHMLQKQNERRLSKSAYSSNKDNDLVKPCPNHNNEVTEFYCWDHIVLICSVCVALEHTPKYCHVELITDISGQTLDGSEYKITLKNIDKLKDKCDKTSKDLKQNLETSAASLKRVIADIETCRKELNDKLDLLENNVKDKAREIKNNNNKKMKRTETACDDINKSLQVSADMLKNLNTKKKAEKLFIELKMAQQQISYHEKRLSLLPISDIDEYIFEPNQVIKKLLLNWKSLGRLAVKEAGTHIQPVNTEKTSMDLPIPRYIKVRNSSDKKECCITGLAVSSQNQIFAADFNNKSIKMTDLENKEIHHLQLHSSPWDISILTRDTLAVTLPSKNTIQFVFFSANQLELKNHLKVDGECHGISQYEGKLAVTFTSQKKLEIIDIDGTEKVRVVNDHNGDNVFSYPGYVTTNSQSIYVSDSYRHAVIWLNWQGVLLGMYDGIACPRGIVMLDDGTFLVGGYHTQIIYKVSGDCSDSEALLKDVESPSAVCWCNKTCALCISRYKVGCKEDVNNQIIFYIKM